MAAFLTPLELEFIDGTKWKVTAPFDYRLGAPDGKEFVHIPAGFITDFASVPRGLWNLLPPIGPYGKAAVVHDWLYQTMVIEETENGSWRWFRAVDRKEADHILHEGMKVLGVNWWTRWAIYLGVRVGGWVPWNKYREQEVG